MLRIAIRSWNKTGTFLFAFPEGQNKSEPVLELAIAGLTAHVASNEPRICIVAARRKAHDDADCFPLNKGFLYKAGGSLRTNHDSQAQIQ